MSNRLAHRAGRLDLRLPPEPPEPPKREGEEPQPGRLIWGLILGLAFGRIAWSLFAMTALRGTWGR
jgi:hypothetical protein